MNEFQNLVQITLGRSETIKDIFQLPYVLLKLLHMIFWHRDWFIKLFIKHRENPRFSRSRVVRPISDDSLTGSSYGDFPIGSQLDRQGNAYWCLNAYGDCCSARRHADESPVLNLRWRNSRIP